MPTNAITAKQLQKAKELFEAATAHPTQRDVLENEYRSDPDLKALLERMIQADSEANVILDQPLSLPIWSQLPEEFAPGTSVGPYRIVREIGAGGMGAVYLANVDDGAAEGSLALKLMNRASPELLHSFKREVAILTSIEHHNIARLLDIGVTDQNTPYLVMEYVEGESVKSYCDRQRLSVRERVRLVRQLCSAVRYLHQNLVVHRDLKPSNVLVTRDGTVKLVDFGIAKLLETQDAPSRLSTTLRMMTPDYASPEQVRGLSPTTLTDVYGLGVLLYELLSGVNPFAGPHREMHETLRAICETEPLSPSAALRSQPQPDNARVFREVRGELDNIVLKAIRKEPERRYQSVEQLDEDLDRYLNHLPVAAQGDSLLYTFRKFVLRHRKGVAFTGVLLVVLLGGILAISYEANVARKERARAEVHAANAEKAKARAENQARIAESERQRAELQSDEAERQRSIAERRLAELQRTAKGAAQLYTATRNTESSPDSGLVAQNTRDLLLVLKSEHALDPELARLLGRVSAHTSTPPTNPVWHLPSGWSADEANPGEYFVTTDHTIVHGGKSSLVVRSRVARPRGSVSVAQTFRADRYHGRRMRFAGYLTLDHVAGQALLYVIARTDNQIVTFDRVSFSGTTEWKQHNVVVDIPGDSDSISIGVQLVGAGTLHADDFSVEQVDRSVALTGSVGPANLEFAKPKVKRSKTP